MIIKEIEVGAEIVKGKEKEIEKEGIVTETIGTLTRKVEIETKKEIENVEEAEVVTEMTEEEIEAEVGIVKIEKEIETDLQRDLERMKTENPKSKREKEKKSSMN